ncbi:hypothetical protein BH11BAC4_BH11BAC4_22890 [soil metagenome]
MKIIINKIKSRLTIISCVVAGLFLLNTAGYAQDSTAAVNAAAPAPAKKKPVKNTFPSIWIIDNQTVTVPVKGTLEIDIQHRFGTVQNGYQDFWGFFAPSNIRLGVNYSPINKLNVGFGITKNRMLGDLNAKYAILTQTKGRYPVSVSYYVNMAYDTRKDKDKTIFKYQSQRLSYFHQLLIARKITNKLSVQVAPSISHQNSIEGYYTKNDSTGTAIFKKMKFDHFAIALSARYKLTNVMSFMINYDQPLTKHATKNPHPNFSFGFEMNTSSHSFQIFAGNYSMLSPQQNNLYNENNPFGYTESDGTKTKGGQFVIGFNITRLWNY